MRRGACRSRAAPPRAPPMRPHPCMRLPRARSHTFNYLKSSQGGEWLFLAAADAALGRQVPFACLERVAEAWQEGGFAARAQRAAAHSFDRAFKPRLRDYVVGAAWCGVGRDTDPTWWRTQGGGGHKRAAAAAFELRAGTLAHGRALDRMRPRVSPPPAAAPQNYFNANPESVDRVAAVQKKVNETRVSGRPRAWLGSTSHHVCAFLPAALGGSRSPCSHRCTPLPPPLSSAHPPVRDAGEHRQGGRARREAAGAAGAHRGAAGVGRGVPQARAQPGGREGLARAGERASLHAGAH
jgi:hypothetical protein